MESEKQNIEHKESWRDEYLKWVCGFANANGGKIYIGVNDKKEVVGLPDAKRLMEDIPNKIACHLGIIVDVNLLTQDDKEYIEVDVAKSAMPISYHGQYFYRSGSTKQELNGASLQDFMLKKMGLTWDKLPVLNATIDDIDRQSIEYFIRDGIKVHRLNPRVEGASTEEVLQYLQLYTDDGKLTAAAILLFGNNVGKFFSDVEFKIGRFHRTESNLITQDIVQCNLIQMADKVIELLRSKYLISPIRFEGMRRIEELEIPEIALRELIYNSIVHKDYTGPSIQMKVFDDCIELWNYGAFPQGLTPQMLYDKHPSIVRNKNIANAFLMAGYIEKWGSGFQRIKEEVEKVGLPMPQIVENCGGVLATMKRFSMSEIIDVQGRNVGVKSHQNVGVKRRKNVGVKNASENPDNQVITKDYQAQNVGVEFDENVGVEFQQNVGVQYEEGDAYISRSSRKILGNIAQTLTKRQAVICNIIQDNPNVTIKGIAEILGINKRTIERDFSVLQEKNIIRHEGGDRYGFWVLIEQ